MMCHHCSHQEEMPPRCPRCSAGLQLGRFGVDYAVDQLRRLWPGQQDRILQFDADQVSRPADYERILTAFAEEKYGLLIGTQMVAKGLDFPAVRLVAILDADQRLNLPDFRAAERTAQLLVQVAGRAGRAGERGVVLIQTSQPNHPAIRAAVTGDYAAFARAELVVRKENHWPPYTRLARAVLQDASLTKLWQSAREWRAACLDVLRSACPSLEILPPHPPLVPRRRNQYRLQVLWRCTQVNELLRALDLLPGYKLSRPKAAGFHWDMDPVAFD
jgi:primosomal protein N' (replication factor Y)